MDDTKSAWLDMTLDIDPDLELGSQRRDELLDSIRRACPFDHHIVRVRISVRVSPDRAMGILLRADDGATSYPWALEDLQTAGIRREVAEDFVRESTEETGYVKVVETGLRY